MFRGTRNLPNPSRWSIIHYTDEKSEESEPPARRPPTQNRNGTTQTKAGRLPDRDRLRRPVPQGTGRRSRVCRIRPARPCPEHRPRPDDSRDAHPAAAAHRHGEQPQPTRPHGACGRVWTRYRHFGDVGRPDRCAAHPNRQTAMIAKLSKGGSFSGAVQYIFGPGKGADCLAGMGVLFKDTPSIIRGFERQAAQNPKVSKPVGHVVLCTLLFAPGCRPVG